jgi:D-alanine-D-alanine ligase
LNSVRSPRESNPDESGRSDGQAADTSFEMSVKTDNQKSGRGRKTSAAAKNGDTFKKLRVIVLCHEDLVPPESIEGLTPKEVAPFKTEWDVISNLKKIGHEVSAVGVYNNLGVIGNALLEHKPQVAFNLLEEFHGYPLYDQHVVSYLELMKQPYTGCNPRGLTICRDKALSKMVLAYHRIHVPAFAVFHMNRVVKRSRRLKFPLLVKSISEEGSVGIARASIVNDDDKLAERVEFIHRQTKTHAIAEQYIAGREIYVSVIGNLRLQCYTPWELVIEKLPEGAPNIATSKLKWDPAYQEKVGVVTKAADLDKKMKQKLERLSKKIYRTLFLSGYARLDYRVTDAGEIYLLEANPNPQIANAEDFADSAQHCGVDYEALLQKIIALGLRYRTGA